MQATQTNSILTVDQEPGYGQLLGVLLRRKFWVLGSLITAIAIASIYTLRQESTYLSGMQLLVEPNYQGKPETQPSLKNEVADPNQVQVDTATQISLMQSSVLVRRAMTLLRSDYPEFDPNNPGLVAAFKSPLKVAQVTAGDKKDSASATKIFQITYVSNDPVKTQNILRALQKVYLDYNREQQKQRLVRGLAFINEQLPQIKTKLKDAESELESFRKNQELINPEAQAQVQADALNRVRQEQQTNQLQLRELRSRYAALQRQLQLSPAEAIAAAKLSQSGRYQTLLNEIQKTDLQLVQQRLRFKDGTPLIQQLNNQRQRQLGLLQAEVQRVLGTDSASTGSGQQLLSSGQLGSLDLNLVSQFVDNQINLQGAESRALSLANYEQQLRTELQRFPELLAQYGRLQPEVDLTRDTLKQLLKAQQDIGLEIARGGFDWQVVEEPQLGGKTGPDMKRNVLLGAVAGLFLGGLAAFARDAMDDAVRSSDDLKKQVPVPLLGMVPALAIEAEDDRPLLSLPFNREQRSLTSATNQVLQWAPFRESLDLLYQNVQLLNMNNPLNSIVVTSALSGEGKSTIILGLAISAARLHQRVLLIDADLRRPSLHKLLNLPNDQGLSTLLTSQAAIPPNLQVANSDIRSNISVITAGPTPADPAKLLSSQRMRDVMATFEESYDLVLLDAPPVLGMVDAMVLGTHTSGVLLVGRLDRVTRSELTQANTMLKNLNVVGVVANGVPRPSRSAAAYQR